MTNNVMVNAMLIDTNKLIEDIRSSMYEMYEQMYNRLDSIIENCTIEEEEDDESILHAHWVLDERQLVRRVNGMDMDMYMGHCSNCGFKTANAMKFWNYCPNCGAKMNEER